MSYVICPRTSGVQRNYVLYVKAVFSGILSDENIRLYNVQYCLPLTGDAQPITPFCVMSADLNYADRYDTRNTN